MQVVILCGGKGTRMWPMTEEIPKPLVKVGDRPILWHLMKIYSKHGHNDFVLAIGHKGEKIMEYFSKEENKEKEWNIAFVETGQNTNKGGRLKKVERYINDENFLVAYGDDLSNVNINEAIKSHIQKGKVATLTAIRPVSQFGILELNDNNEVLKFKEKPVLEHFINGGFFVFNKKIFDYIKEGWELEGEVFETLAKERQVNAFKHDGFWICMNTQKDIIDINKLWTSGKLKELLYS